MTTLLTLLALFIVFGPIIFAISAHRRSGRAEAKATQVERSLLALERAFAEFRTSASAPTRSVAPPVTVPSQAESVPVAIAAHEPELMQAATETVDTPPPLPISPAIPAQTAFNPLPSSPVRPTEVEAALPPVPARSAAPVPARLPEPKAAFNLEQFMGAKGFAWIGGFALFLTLIFFIKYSFEHNWIPEIARAAIGYIVATGLVVGGVAMKRKSYAVTAHTLCATGILMLYGMTMACREYYQFPFFDVIPTFILMTLITAAAFVMAASLGAQVIAVLGMLGGFLTPLLLSTGHDNPGGLFGYIALIDAGLIAIALRCGWRYLVPLGAGGTILWQWLWAMAYFEKGGYTMGNRVLIPMGIQLGLLALFLAGSYLERRKQKPSKPFSNSTLALALSAFVFAIFYLFHQPIAARPLLLFGFVFLIDLAILGFALLDDSLAEAQPAAGIGIFGLLALWTSWAMTPAMLHSALALFFIFTLFHTVTPLLIGRLRGNPRATKLIHAFPILALALVLLPLIRLAGLSFIVWPFVFLIDLIAVAAAIALGALLPILFVLILTLVVVGAWITRIPTDLTGLPASLGALGFFAVFFIAAGAYASRRYLQRGGKAGSKQLAGVSALAADSLAAIIPACSAVLPFALLIMLVLSVPLTSVAPVFGLAMLLAALVLGISRMLEVEALPLAGLLSVVALEYAWFSSRFQPHQAAGALAWFLGFYALFTLYPFFFRKQLSSKTMPWVAAALSGPLHFLLIKRVIEVGWPNPVMGLVPAAFVLPSLLGLVAILRSPAADGRKRDSQLALFGGAALFFITLIFPIQFDREWLTLGWALEGMALCWLYQRVAHPGLRVTGVALLIVAFARLTLNTTIFRYHIRGDHPILNWYLYAYTTAAAAIFLTAWLLAPPREKVLGKNVRPLLFTMGTILLFFLVNIEIADFFTAPGAASVTLQFSDNLARDMSYSIAWSLFALLLLIVGIRHSSAGARQAALGLLAVAVLKLFIHDLANLAQLYRIAAFGGVAVIAMAASFLYQRFMSQQKPHDPS